MLLDLGNVLAFHDNDKLFREMSALFKTTPVEIRQRLDGGLWERVNRGGLRGDSLRVEMNARLGGAIEHDAWIALWNCHFTINHEMVALIEPIAERCVLVSNTHDQHVSFLRPQLPVLERFKGLVLSCEIGALKPEAKIYREALRIAGVGAEKAVFFDDVPAYVEAARREGIRGCVFTTAEQARRDLVALGVI